MNTLIKDIQKSLKFISAKQQAIKGPKMTSVKQFKQGNHQFNLYKKGETLINHIDKLHPLNNRFLTYDRCKQMQQVKHFHRHYCSYSKLSWMLAQFFI